MYLKRGMKIQIHYAKKKEKMIKKKYRDAIGIIIVIGKGRGPKNVLVKIKNDFVVVPRGNIRIIKESE